ncbi:Gfo/Idh/MocA family oxidoreductase [bacterium]|jgi:predicted dehydrogenase|nr:Gfo/Idh/MocA family oxidoreductase [bacterium]
MSNKIKNIANLGFIGGGISSSIGNAHFMASQLDGRWKVVSGFFSRDIDISRETANIWNIEQSRAYSSLSDFIESEISVLDAVVVLTPAPNHVDVIISLLKAGIPIICEKPIVSSVKEAELIQEQLKKTPNFLAVTYNYSGYPMVREIRELVKNGKLGEIQKIHFEMPQEGFIRNSPVTKKLSPPKGWRLQDGAIPTICLDLGVHLHHLANFITNKNPQNVMGLFSNHSIYSDVVDDVMMWLNYNNGMKGSFWMSKTALGSRNGLKLRIYGTKGSVEWVQTNPEILHLSYNDGSKVSLDRASKTLVCSEPRYNRYISGHPAGFIEAFANLYSDIADALEFYNNTGEFKNTYVFGLDHSIFGLKLFESAKESHDSCSWVNLDKSLKE